MLTTPALNTEKVECVSTGMESSTFLDLLSNSGAYESSHLKVFSKPFTTCILRDLSSIFAAMKLMLFEERRLRVFLEAILSRWVSHAQRQGGFQFRDTDKFVQAAIDDHGAHLSSTDVSRELLACFGLLG